MASPPLATIGPASLLLLYGLDITLLAVYGLYALFQTLVFWQQPASPDSDDVKTSPKIGPEIDPAPCPNVTLQLPIYNERHVVQRLIEAATALDWPAEKLQIQILDDSTDDTSDQIRAVLSRLEAAGKTQGISIEHCQRRDRAHFKAGALQQGLATATGAFIAIFDADFIPPPNFLQRTLPAFDDATTGCVQARWGHLNPNSSLLTRAQAVGIDGHFIVEQQVRHRLGAFLNFNGTAGVWRRDCLEQVGGWQGDTLTEDLDLSYRLQLQGWHIVYLPEVVVPAELPVQLSALKRQQFRWAKGSIQTAIKLWRPLWRSPQPRWRKLLATLHLTQYAVHPLMVLNLLLILPISLEHSPLLNFAPLFTVAALGPPLMYWAALGELEGEELGEDERRSFAAWRSPSRWGRLERLGILLALGTGLSVNNTKAVIEALVGIPSEFQRTPKFALVDRQTAWQTSDYVLASGVLASGWLVWVELLLGSYALGLMGYCGVVGLWWMLPWLGLYASGYGAIAGLSLVQAWQRQRMIPKALEVGIGASRLRSPALKDP